MSDARAAVQRARDRVSEVRSTLDRAAPAPSEAQPVAPPVRVVSRAAPAGLSWQVRAVTLALVVFFPSTFFLPWSHSLLAETEDELTYSPWGPTAHGEWRETDLRRIDSWFDGPIEDAPAVWGLRASLIALAGSWLALLAGGLAVAFSGRRVRHGWLLPGILAGVAAIATVQVLLPFAARAGLREMAGWSSRRWDAYTAFGIEPLFALVVVYVGALGGLYFHLHFWNARQAREPGSTE